MIAAKLISTEIQFFHGKKMEDIINRLKLPSISKFLFSPLTDKSNSLKVAVFVKENKVYIFIYNGFPSKNFL